MSVDQMRGGYEFRLADTFSTAYSHFFYQQELTSFQIRAHKIAKLFTLTAITVASDLGKNQ